MKIVNYIILDQGHCEEAFRLYQEVLGGTITTARFSSLGMESPKGQDYIINNHLVADGIELMGGDNSPQYEYEAGTSLGLYLILPSVEEAKAALAKFGAKAEILMEFHSSEYTEGYAYLKDSYGIFWHIGVQRGLRKLMPYMVPDNGYQAMELLPYYQSLLFNEAPEVIYFSDVDASIPDGDTLIAKATFHDQALPAMILSEITPDQQLSSIGSNFSIALLLPSLEAAKALFDKFLQDDSEIIMPFGEMPWSVGYGMVSDKFGFTWQISVAS